MYNDKEYNNGENVDVLQEKENVMSYSQIKGCKTKGTNKIGWKSSLKHFLMHSPILEL